ncbi:hypothetical protein GpartN1_g1361.t1 [Galdieria partita]|uniref:HTH cro/C1-type domain-containing protein n=1 Tax=Galdieria partita TaxID=83374 RepID=A0A9C7PS93_9RHOD|nr:hypothetical protein GpartN1_g1361.t1 [Galdieria partita]
MKEQHSKPFTEDDTSRFLTPETVGTEELFLSPNHFESGPDCPIEYDLLLSLGQKKRESRRPEELRFYQMIGPNATFIEGEVDSENMFNLELNFLVDSEVPEQGPTASQSASLYCVSEDDCYSSVCQSGTGEGNLQDIYPYLSQNGTERRGPDKERITQACPFQSDLQTYQDNFMTSSTCIGSETSNFVREPVGSGYYKSEATRVQDALLDQSFQSRSFTGNSFLPELSSGEYWNGNFSCSTERESSIGDSCFGSNIKGLSKRRYYNNSSNQEIPSSVDEFERWRLEINSLLKHRGLSRREFAKSAGIGKNTVGKYLSGHCKRVSREVVYKMLHAFHIIQSRDRIEVGISQSGTKSSRSRRLALKQREALRFSQYSNCSPIQTDWDRINRTSFVEMEKMNMVDTVPFQDVLFSDEREPKTMIPIDLLNTGSYHSCDPSQDLSADECFISEEKLETSQAVSTIDKKTENPLTPSCTKVKMAPEHTSSLDFNIIQHEYLTEENELSTLHSISSNNEKSNVVKLAKSEVTSCQYENESYETEKANEQIQDLVEESYYIYSEPFQEPPTVICFMPVQIEIRIPGDKVDEERNFTTLYSWRWGDKRQSVESIVSEIAKHYNVPSKHTDILKSCVESALARHGLLDNLLHSTSSRRVRLDLDLGDNRRHSEEFHVDYPWPENFPYIFARQICMDLNISPQHIERIAVNIIGQLIGDK